MRPTGAVGIFVGAAIAGLIFAPLGAMAWKVSIPLLSAGRTIDSSLTFWDGLLICGCSAAIVAAIAGAAENIIRALYNTKPHA